MRGVRLVAHAERIGKMRRVCRGCDSQKKGRARVYDLPVSVAVQISRGTSQAWASFSTYSKGYLCVSNLKILCKFQFISKFLPVALLFFLFVAVGNTNKPAAQNSTPPRRNPMGAQIQGELQCTSSSLVAPSPLRTVQCIPLAPFPVLSMLSSPKIQIRPPIFVRPVT